ncbi:MAG: glycosyltransferase, partial [Allosphingosinicella sp.]
AMAKTVVATEAAFEGIEAQPDRDLIVVGDARAMAGNIVSLLRAPERAQQIGEAARRRMADGYGWDQRLAVLDEILSPAAQQVAA